MIKFAHFNFNVLDLEKSLKFYKEALNLDPVREFIPEDESFKLVYLGDKETDFQLELTWLRDRKDPYNLGECEFHLAFETDKYDELYKLHKEMGCIAFENLGMGIYFIAMPFPSATGSPPSDGAGPRESGRGAGTSSALCPRNR